MRAQVSGHIIGENEAVESLDVDQEVTDAAGGGHIVMDDGSFVSVDCTIPRDISSMTPNFIGTGGKLYMNNDDGEWRYWSLKDGEHIEEPLPGIDDAWMWEDDYKRSFANAAIHVEATRSLEIIVGFYLTQYTESTVDVPLSQTLRDISITSL